MQSQGDSTGSAREEVCQTALPPAPSATPVALLAEPPLPPTEQPLYASLLTWIEAALRDQGHSRPTCKRLALLVAGLLDREQGTPSAIAHTAFTPALAPPSRSPVSPAASPACSTPPQLDPARLLPVLATALLPALLADACRAHDHSVGAQPHHATHHARWLGVRLVLDETSHTDQTHVLVVGLAYRGVVLPLGVRTWPQTTACPRGTYWPAVGSLLTEVQAPCPPLLRAHVLLLADRAYGVPALFALLTALGWAGVLRAQGQIRVRLPDGTERALRTLVPGPARSGPAPRPPLPPAPSGAACRPRRWACSKAPGGAPCTWSRSGPRASRALAAGHHLAPPAARLLDYAARWAIERLFLGWKSHGWQLEATR